ncbi:MAG TPA: energy-coupling factor transporter transmembrane component T [Candidatus Cryosericum sp.]|nr:energy-coupling factor transporter transmembrane component T [Candidatus Cryosericum sp.]
MKAKLFDYIERHNAIFDLSGVTKLLCFLMLTGAVMFSFDIRVIGFVLVFSLVILKISGIQFYQIKLMLIYVVIFLVINFILTFVFAPTYGTEIYKTAHVLFRIVGRYYVTSEQLLYQSTQTLKYASVVPLGIIFFLSTNPSELAASINRAGISYKAAFAFSLTLRYFPDLIRDYQDISAAQQSRGLDLSKKEKLGKRVKNILNITIPLIFSTLERIETISNTMDLRGFGKEKKRTWYAAKPLKRGDIVALAASVLILLATIAISVFVNHSKFYNPFV